MHHCSPSVDPVGRLRIGRVTVPEMEPVVNASRSLHDSPPRSSPFRSPSHRAGRHPGRTRGIAFNAGVLLALLLSLVMPVGAFRPAPARAAVGLEVTISVVTPALSLGDMFEGTWSFTDPLGGAWTATVDYGEGGSSFLGSVEPGTTYPLSYTYTSAGDKTVMVEVDNGISPGGDSVMVSVNLPDIVPAEISVNDGIPVTPGQSVLVAWNDTNQGLGDIFAWTSWTDQIWLSGDAEYQAGVDALLQEAPLQAIERTSFGGWLYASMMVTIPDGLDPGTYYMLILADEPSVITETDEGNNIAWVAFTVGSTTNTAPVADPGGAYTAGVDEWITLDGSGSYDPDGDSLLDQAWDINYDGVTFNPTYYGATPMVSYAVTGTYTVALQVRDSLYLPSDIVTTTVTVTAPRADLAPGLYSVYPVQVDPGANIIVYWGDANVDRGTIPAGTSWTDQIYLSTDTVLNEEIDVYLGEYAFTLTDDLWTYVTVDTSLEVTIPAETAQGAYFILLKADSGDAIDETSEGNNVTSLAMNIGTPQYDLVVESVTPAVFEAKPGAQVVVSWVDRNDGSFTIVNGWWYDELYLSTDTTLDGSDIDTYIGWQGVSVTLASGESYPSSLTVTIPIWVTPGTYYILVNADAINYVPETVETNNVLASGPITITALNVDLAPVSMTPSATSVASGDQFTIEVKVVNNGPDAIPAMGSWASVIYLSADDTLDTAEDREFAYRWEEGPLAAGATRTSTVYVMGVPFDIPDGTFTLFLVADGTNALAESEEGNNVLPITATITIDELVFDLEPVSIVPAATEVMIGDTLPITWIDANIGGDAIPGDRDWYDTVHLTTDPTGESGGMYLLEQQFTGASLVDGQVSFTAYPTISVQVQPGTYYLILEVDRYSYIYESEETNNMLVSGPITITAPEVDLVPVSINAAATSVELDDSFSVTVVTQNVGPDAVPEGMYWNDGVYLSVDESFDPAEDIPAGTFWRSGPVGAGALVTRPETCYAWSQPGFEPDFYHLLFVADPEDSIPETREDNNVLLGPTIEVRARDIDLVPDALAFTPAAAVPGDRVTVTWSIRNDGTSSPSRGWTDEVYLSTDQTLDATDARILSAWVDLTTTNAYVFVVPQVIPSDEYYVILRVDIWDNIAETLEENNIFLAEGTLTVTNGVSLDLEPVSLVADPDSGTPDGLVSVTYTVANHGPDAIPAGTWHSDSIFFSRDEVIDEDDWVVTEVGNSEIVEADGTYTWTVGGYLSWDEEPGPGFIILSINHYDHLVETVATNNIMVIPFTVDDVTNTAPVVVINHADPISLGDDFESDGTVTDPDPGDTFTAMVDYGDGTVADLAIVDSTFNLSHVYATAGPFIVTVTVSDGTDTGSDEATVTVEAPDITVSVYTVSDGNPVAVGDPVTIDWDDTNDGPGDILAGTGWIDAVYLSTDATFDLGDTRLADVPVDSTYRTDAGVSLVAGTTVAVPDGTAPGDYIIIVVADANGALTEANEANNIGTQTITVGPANTLPTVTLGADVTVDEGLPFTRTGSFSDSDVGDTHTATVDYGEGDGPASLALNADNTFTLDHTYMENGTYFVTVVVSDGSEVTGLVLAPVPIGGSATIQVMVNNVAPVVDPINPVTLVAGQTMEQTVTFSDPGADAWTVEVDYDGDGVVDETGAATVDRMYNLSHVYASAGTFTVAVTVTDDDLAPGTVSFPVMVESANQPPVAVISGPTTVDEGAMATYNATTSTDPDGDELTYAWDVDGDGTFESEGEPEIYMVWPDGSATTSITLRVTEPQGLSDTETVEVTVKNVSPTVDLGGGATVAVGDSFGRNGSFSDPGDDIWGAVVDYGDGSGEQSLALAGTDFYLDHTYTSAGAFDVTVTVTDSDDAIGSATIPVTVTAEANVAPTVGTLLASPANPAVGGIVQLSVPFMDANPGDNHTATVDWGDDTGVEDMVVTESGGSGTATASHSYAAKGKYTITVTVRDGDLDATATLGIRLTPAPAANVAPVAVPGGPYAVMVNTSLVLDGSGSYDPNNNLPLTWEWDTNYNGSTFTTNLTGMTPATSYADAGTYTVALRVTDSLGLTSAVATTAVTVTDTEPNVAPVVGAITVVSGSPIAGTTVTISATFSDGNTGDKHTAMVNWGDGTQTEAMAVEEDGGNGIVGASHLYASKGKYTVTVTVTDTVGPGSLSGQATTTLSVAKAPKNTTVQQQEVPVIEEPTDVPAPTVVPTDVPAPTLEPTTVPEPTATPEPTPVPETPTVTVQEVATPMETDEGSGE